MGERNSLKAAGLSLQVKVVKFFTFTFTLASSPSRSFPELKEIGGRSGAVVHACSAY